MKTKKEQVKTCFNCDGHKDFKDIPYLQPHLQNYCLRRETFHKPICHCECWKPKEDAK